ncbi:MAG: glycoside hydrolase domain-containing protein [Acidimicrobiales bacterium]
MEGVDYSFARPDPQCLANRGFRFAGRYVGHDQRGGKDITRAEAIRLHNAGIKVVTIYQPAAAWLPVGSFDEGFVAARDAEAQAADAGMPADRPIYFVVDSDPASISAARWAAVEDWFVGAGTFLGVGRAGVYGGLATVERLVPTFARWAMQTAAWSAGRWSGKAHIRQHTFNVARCGGNVDLDTATATDFGGW